MLLTLEEIKKWNLCKILVQTGNVINVELPCDGKIEAGLLSALQNCFSPLLLKMNYNADTKKCAIKHDALVKEGKKNGKTNNK